MDLNTPTGKVTLCHFSYALYDAAENEAIRFTRRCHFPGVYPPAMPSFVDVKTVEIGTLSFTIARRKTSYSAKGTLILQCRVVLEYIGKHDQNKVSMHSLNAGQTVELPIIEFKTQTELRTWLINHHAISCGAWVRVFKKFVAMPSVTFEQLLDEGLCFGWSESNRLSYDEISYLQKFTPRKTNGTTSERNRKQIQALIESGQMTQSGLDVL